MAEKGGQVVKIDDLLWTQTRFSDVLRLDRRLVAQALATAPAQQRGSSAVWHVRDGMPAIYRRVLGADDDGGEIPKHPKDRLDHYRAERERLKLEAEQRAVLPAAEVAVTTAALLKTLAQRLEILPAQMERDYGLSPEETERLHAALDAARESLYSSAMEFLDARSATA